MHALKVLHSQMHHKLTDQFDRIAEVRPGDGQVYKASDYLSKPCRVACHFGVGEKFHIPMQRSRDGLAFRHIEFEETTRHIMALTDQYAFWGADHFHPKEIMKVTEILHFEGCR